MSSLTKISILFFVLNSIACSKQNAYRDDAQQQNALSAQVKRQQIQAVVGNYCGTMNFGTISDNSTPFAVTISLKVVDGNIKSAQDPTQVVQSPSLGGRMQFPVMLSEGSAAWSDLGDLTAATGGQPTITFNSGDVNPSIALPDDNIFLTFAAPQREGNYGEVRGRVTHGHFVGNWYSLGGNIEVGTFDLSTQGCAS